ncbi:hypothetical protein [Pimelobacter simplex]|uniref:hypothetical protein n=1 Tax=Nocardioides simplex TaxID=2045 RepID=UPI003AAD7915
MIQLALAFVTGVFALLPAVLVTPRRRQLNHIKEEAEVIKGLPDGPAKKNMEAAHVASTEAYERRVKGLDKVDKLRRRMVVVLPLAYAGSAVLVLGWLRRQGVADYFDVRLPTAGAGIVGVGVLLVVPLLWTYGQYSAAARDRQDRLDKEVERLEKVDAARAATAIQRETFHEALSKVVGTPPGLSSDTIRRINESLSRTVNPVNLNVTMKRDPATGAFKIASTNPKDQDVVDRQVEKGKEFVERQLADQKDDEDPDKPMAPAPVS